MGVFREKDQVVNGKYMLSEESQEIIRDMNSRMNGLTLSDIQVISGNRFRFPVYIGMKEMENDIDVMELSTRGNNALKRNGIETVSDLIEAIECESELLGMRNLGAKTAKEIMFGLFLYQFKQLPEGRKESYMKRLMDMNGIVSLNEAA